MSDRDSEKTDRKNLDEWKKEPKQPKGNRHEWSEERKLQQDEGVQVQRDQVGTLNAFHFWEKSK